MNLRRLLFLVICVLLAPFAARAQTTATLTPSTTTLNPAGGQVTFSFAATFTGTAAATGLTVNFPANWTYVSGTSEPSIKPFSGATGSLAWASINPLTAGLAFTFTVSYPAGLNTVSVSSSFIARFGSTPNETIPAPIVFGSAPVITTQPTSQTVTAGASATLNVVVSGTAPLAYQWRKDDLTLTGATSASLVLTSFQATNAGTYSVVVSNSIDTVTSQNAVLTLAPTPGGGGTTPVAPSITGHPTNVTVDAGATATFTVAATGTSPLTYQWRKGTTDISGATAATLTLIAVLAADEVPYSVVVSNAAGSATSNAATLTVRTPPILSVPPVAVTVDEGQPASFSVTATGTSPLTYQWRKGGTAIAGATSSTLSFARAAASDAGNYTVVVSNAVASITSPGVALTVRPSVVTPVGFAGGYFGAFGNGGSFALHVRADGSAVFLGYATNASATFLVRDLVVDSAGRIRFTTTTAPAAAASSSEHPIAAAGDYTVDATISSTGALTGTVSGLTSLSATRSAATGSTLALAGFYQAGAINSSAASYAIVSPAGQAFILTVTPTATDAGTGTVDATGRLAVTTTSNATVTGTLATTTSTLTASITTAAGAKTDFIGGSDTRVATEKLFNIATRGPVGSQSGEMIAGFVIRGDAPKTVLIRAVGPGLAAFGLTTAVSTPRLELFRDDSTSLAVNTGWGAVTEISAAAARVGAFALTPNSKDAVLLVALTPGAYTAVVSGDNGTSGVALVEVYDASDSPGPSQKIVNIASRGTAGGGDSTLTAGFVINGTVPKRVLLRGIGPTLGGFGVPGTLADPQLKLFDQPGAIVATNDDWSTPATATAATAAQISAAATAVGAFALAPASKDAALLLYLAPGPYTAQLGTAGTATGGALIEVYEVP